MLSPPNLFSDPPKPHRIVAESRRDRSIKYLRAKSAPHKKSISRVSKKISKWSTVRQKSPIIVAKARLERNPAVLLDFNKRFDGPNISNQLQIIPASKNFSDVVKTAMLVRNWMTSMEHDQRESEPDREEPLQIPENEQRGILETDQETFVIRPSGAMILKELLIIGIRRLLYFYVSPNSSIYYYWTCLVAFGLLYNMFAMVIFIFDDVYLGYFNTWLTLNSIFDGLYLADIFLQSRLTFMHDGQEVKNTYKLWINYLESARSIPDILCLLPLDLFLLLNPSLSLIRLIRLLKSHRLNDFMSLTQKRTDFPHATKILFLTTSCAVLFHWNACVYFFFSLFEGLSEDDTEAFGFSYYKVFDPRFPVCEAYYDKSCWFEEYADQVLDLRIERPKYMQQMYEYWNDRYYKLPMGNFSREYSMTMYWSALTITKCGQQPWPSTSPQNLLEVVDTLIGVLVFATIIGSVGNVVTQMNQSVYDFREMMDGIKFYMKYRAVHLDIQERVLNCFMYLNTHNQLYDEKETLEVLPARFQSNIAANLHLETLKRVQLFSNCDNRFLHEVVLLVKQQVYSPNDYLCRKNEKAKEMFIVKKGTLGVIDDDTGVQLEQLYEGSTFGELSIIHVKGNLLGDRRSVSLRSVGYSDIYVLHQDHVTRLLQEYPDDRDVLLRNARSMLHSRGLLQTSQHGEMCESDDDQDYEGMIELLSVDEQLSRLQHIVRNLDDDLTHMISSFTHTTLYYKQRVTSLENTFNFNRKRIRRDCIRGVL